MRLTTKSSYGVRALVNLALEYDKNQPVSIKEIAAKEGISKIYLEQIFNRLKRKGLIKSVRGPKGGYSFSKDPSNVSVYEAVTALDENLSPVKCFPEEENKNGTSRSITSASSEVWNTVERGIIDTLTTFSFKDLADRSLELDSNSAGSI